MLTVVYIQFPAALSVAELPSACSLHKTRLTHYSLSTCYSLCYACSAYLRLYKEERMLSLQGRQCTQDLCSIAPVTCERHCQRGSHIQRKNSGINLHRTWIPVTSQCLDDFPGLAVIEHVHDIAVPEGMWCDRNRKMHRRTRPLRVKKLFEERTSGSIRKRPRPFQAKRLKKSKK